MGLRIAFIIRPSGDNNDHAALQRCMASLRSRGHRVRPRVTFEEGDARRFARVAGWARYDLVVAVGGDGTVNEVVNGIARSRWQPRLGIVPAGTANDFAAGMELPSDIEEAVEVAVGGRPAAVDVARVNDRLFINVSTGGFGAEATESTPQETKRLLGPFAYVVTGVKKFVDLRPAGAVFRADGETLYDGQFMLFAVGNARRTGGGSVLTPRAEFGDGMLDVTIVPELPRVDFLALLPDLRSGAHLNSPDVIYTQAERLEIDADAMLTVNADGEPLRGRRFEYGLLRRPLSVMVPADSDLAG